MKTEIFIALVLGTILGLGGMLVVAQLSSRASLTPRTPQTTASPTSDQTSTQTTKNELLSPTRSMSWDTTPLPIKGSAQNGNFVFLVGDMTDTVLPLTSNLFTATTPALSGIAGYRLFSGFGDKIGEGEVLSFKDLPQNKQLVFGSVTDLTAESLQMRGNDGTIDQVAYAPSIVVGSFVKDIKKIPTSDVAIGDKVVVVSESVEKGSMLALGIFVLPSDFAQQDYTLKTGTLSQINKTDLTITTKDGDISVKTDTNTKFFGIKDNGTVRKRTKLIAGDKTSTVYATFLTGTQNLRSLFISE